MKIQRAVVEEHIGPNGIYAKPRLALDLDVQRLPKAVPAGVVRDGTALVHGRRHSFVADLFVVGADDSGPNHINSYYPGRPWFPVSLNDFKADYQWYIPLDRARKELGKHQTDWMIVTDDAFATQGDFVWRLREKELLCKAPSEPGMTGIVGQFCLDPATTEVRRHDYYIPLCSQHHQQLTTDTIRRKGGRR